MIDAPLTDDADVLALLEECRRVGPNQLIEDGEFAPINDERF